MWQQHDAEDSLEEYSASAEEWRLFLKSRVWKDFQFFIQDSLEIGRDLLELEPEQRTIKESDASLRGGMKALRRVMDFPREQLLELEENDRRRDDTDGRNPGV